MPHIRKSGAMALDDAFAPPWRATPEADEESSSGDNGLLFDPWSDWSEADLILDLRIDALERWKDEVSATAALVCLEWSVASLQDVRDRLREMRAVVTNARARHLIRRDSLLVQYLAETYVWTGDVLTDVRALVEELDGGLPAGPRSAEESSAYIDEFLEPLRRQIERCRLERGADPELAKALAKTARLQEAIVALDWGLRAEAYRTPHFA